MKKLIIVIFAIATIHCTALADTIDINADYLARLSGIELTNKFRTQVDGKFYTWVQRGYNNERAYVYAYEGNTKKTLCCYSDITHDIDDFYNGKINVNCDYFLDYGLDEPGWIYADYISNEGDSFSISDLPYSIGTQHIIICSKTHGLLYSEWDMNDMCRYALQDIGAKTVDDLLNTYGGLIITLSYNYNNYSNNIENCRPQNCPAGKYKDNYGNCIYCPRATNIWTNAALTQTAAYTSHIGAVGQSDCWLPASGGPYYNNTGSFSITQDGTCYY